MVRYISNYQKTSKIKIGMDRTDTLVATGTLLLGVGVIAFLFLGRKKPAVYPTTHNNGSSNSGNNNDPGSTNNNNNPYNNTTTMDPKDYPRGYRNNNPLNIRINPANNWEGKIANNTDGAFEQFISMEYGYRAALKLIRNYITKNGLNTVAKIISKWAPNNENRTDVYINFVCEQTGFLPTTVIDPYSKQQMCDLVYAMAIMENGWDILPNYAQIYQGWELL